MHYCSYHKIKEKDDNFRILKNGKLDSYCIEARREYGRKFVKEKYSSIKKQNEEKRIERENRTHQICTICKIDKPIDDFRFRYDRPTKRESRCKDCLGEIKKISLKEYNDKNRDKIRESKRKYRIENPEVHRKASRKRRFQKQQIYKIPYSEIEIRERDKELCYFCKEYIDLKYKYPHKLSQTIHHIHPINKRGPDIPKNVTIAHNECNSSAKDKLISPFKENWYVVKIDNKLAREIMIKNHYLHRSPNTSYSFGLYNLEKLMGVIIFGSTSSNRTAKSVCPDDVTLVLELNRVWIDDNVPFGAASWFISRTLKQLPPFIIISYTDTGVINSFNNPHNGGIYKSLSFNYAGKSKPTKEWRLPGKTRNIGKYIDGAEQINLAPKNRFWTVTGNKKQKFLLRSLCKWPSLPYE